MIETTATGLLGYMPRALLAILVLAASYLLGRYLAKLLTAMMNRSLSRDVHESLIRTLILFVVLFIGTIISLDILGLEKLASSMLAGGGVTAIVLGFAFREIGENFLAGLFLAFSRPFKIGDAIKTEDIEGKVQDIELRYTHLRTDDGRDIYVPSSQLFNKPLTNFTKDGLRRISFSVGIDYSNDARAACLLLQDTVRSVAGVLAEPGCGSSITSLATQYVDIQVFFWVDVFDKARKASAIRTEVMDNCRQALLREGYIVSSETTTNIAIVENSSTTPGGSA